MGGSAGEVAEEVVDGLVVGMANELAAGPMGSISISCSSLLADDVYTGSEAKEIANAIV